ncbi:hypothetical protein BHE74_00050406 [Ensete ventricosum]|nr:hypothetical protein GW17_00045248 [Ensete ventricosum]RWW43880.1 hypothetical protein BHE74_00050406 [Ensete ventricosum]
MSRPPRHLLICFSLITYLITTCDRRRSRLRVEMLVGTLITRYALSSGKPWARGRAVHRHSTRRSEPWRSAISSFPPSLLRPQHQLLRKKGKSLAHTTHSFLSVE